MKNDLVEIAEFVNNTIEQFHSSKLRILQKLNLSVVLSKKNPYLFKAKNLTLASDLVKDILDAYLSSSEEKIFGDFLEGLAIFVANMKYGGRKSPATGIDLEFMKDNVLYLVSIKSGPNWGNSGQQKKQEDDLKNAIKVLKQGKQSLHIEPVLGICYGRAKDTYKRGYLKLEGQSFWNLISGDKEFYRKIIEPLGYNAKQHNDNYQKEKDGIYNRFTREFFEKFCDKNGAILWGRLVEFNSGNLETKGLANTNLWLVKRKTKAYLGKQKL